MGCCKLKWVKKLSMRFSRRTHLFQLASNDSRKYKNYTDDVKPLYLSEKDLDNKLAATALKMGSCKMSLLKHLDMVKTNEPSHNKRYTKQNNPTNRLINVDAVSRVMRKIAIKKANNNNLSTKDVDVACS